MRLKPYALRKLTTPKQYFQVEVHRHNLHKIWFRRKALKPHLTTHCCHPRCHHRTSCSRISHLVWMVCNSKEIKTPHCHWRPHRRSSVRSTLHLVWMVCSSKRIKAHRSSSGNSIPHSIWLAYSSRRITTHCCQRNQCNGYRSTIYRSIH